MQKRTCSINLFALFSQGNLAHQMAPKDFSEHYRKRGTKEMSRYLFYLAAILVLFLFVQPSWAMNAYITDSFKVTLRTGPSNQNKIIAMLSSGQSVEVLDSDGDWSHVRLSGNDTNSKEGWVMSQYLVTRVPWELQVKSLKQENDRLKEKLPRIEKELREANDQEQELMVRLKNSTEALNKLQKDYEALKQGAESYLNLKETYDKTKSLLIAAQKDLQELTEENVKLKASQRNKWFLSGALVLLSGLIIGLLFGRKQKKQKSSVYSLPRK